MTGRELSGDGRELSGELCIVPEPSPDERQAITRTLADADVLPPGYRSAWRHSGTPGLEDDMTPELGNGDRLGEPNGGAP